MKSKITLAYLSIIATCTIWGLSYLSSKYLLDTLHPMSLAFYRFIIAIIIILFINIIFKNNLKIHKADLPRFITCGIFGITLYYTFENYGIELTSASIASIIIATIPIISMLTNLLIMKNKVTPRIIVSVVLSFIGVTLVIDKGDQSNVSTLGIVLMMCAAFSWIIFNYLTKPLYKKYSELTITTYQIIFGSVALLPFALFNQPDFHSFSAVMWGNLFFLGIFCSAVGYFLYIFALQNLNVTLTTLFVNCIPLVSVTSSVILLNEHLSIMQLLGGICIIMAVLISTIKKQPPLQVS
ncbi:DMT family transporter [Vallitalea okinawensis]|uniref:DMT family transporter n=1 Tax=Vallitalea okinawensis TaxID=2078660 RepID=UPI000CFCD503|nr:DMT family transporter [Vallitalea okinawensis]